MVTDIDITIRISTVCERRVSAIKSKDPSADAGKQVQHTDAMENLFRNILIRHTSASSRLEEVGETDVTDGESCKSRNIVFFWFGILDQIA